MDLTTKSDVFSNLEENKPNPIIQEEIFTRYYLPFYRVPNPPMEAMTNLIHYHLNITDNPYQSLDVYRGSEYLFTVPPLYRDDLDKRLNEFGKNNLSAILAEISLCQTTGNSLDATRLSLNELVMTVDDKQALTSEHANAWKKIFDFYDIKPVKYDPDGKVEIVGLDGSEETNIKDVQVQVLDDL